MTQQTDFRSICAELVHIANALDGKNALISNQGQAMDGYSALAAFRDVADRARAALAAEADGPAVPDGREPASVVGEPSDEELLELAGDWPATTGPRHDLSGCPEVQLYSVFADEVVEFARAVLARYGHQPAPSVEGGQRHPTPVPVAEPVAEGPTDEELLELWFSEGWDTSASWGAVEFARAVLARWGNHVPGATKMVGSAPTEGEGVKPTRDDLWELWLRLNNELPDRPAAVAEFWEHAQIDARARYGHQPAPPAEGEVGELVAWLRMQGEAQKPGPNSLLSDQTKKEHHAVGVKLTRAAKLLEQRHPTPVPVSERLPEARDCLGRPTEESDAGWCWTYSDVSETWSFESVVFPRPYHDLPLVRLKPSVTHWIPHYALPLPQGEVE